MFQRETPKFPTNNKGIFINKTFDRNSEPAIWQQFAEQHIKRKLDWHSDIGIDETPIRHISIFGLAPMPFLMYLGKCVGDIIPCDIYQAQRNIEDTNDRWVWSKNKSSNFQSIKEKVVVKKPNSNKVLIAFEIQKLCTHLRFIADNLI